MCPELSVHEQRLQHTCAMGMLTANCVQVFWTALIQPNTHITYNMHHIVGFFHNNFHYSGNDKVCNKWRRLECLEYLLSTLLSQQSWVFLASEGAQ